MEFTFQVRSKLLAYFLTQEAVYFLVHFEFLRVQNKGCLCLSNVYFYIWHMIRENNDKDLKVCFLITSAIWPSSETLCQTNNSNCMNCSELLFLHKASSSFPHLHWTQEVECKQGCKQEFQLSSTMIASVRLTASPKISGPYRAYSGLATHQESKGSGNLSIPKCP